MGKKINKNKYKKNKENNNEEVIEVDNFHQIDELSIILNKVKIYLNLAKFK
jgi:hypothetical protein